MKGAVNPPASGQKHYNLGSMNFILAHELTNEDYKDAVTPWIKKKYTILDNGADELGQGMTGHDFNDLIEEVRPHEYIFPDKLQDYNETVSLTDEFINIFGVPLKKKYPDMNAMAVAQGSTFDDWMNCYITWMNSPWVDVIGIPYDIDFPVNPEVQADLGKTDARAAGRLALVTLLEEKGMLLKPIHLLGMNNLTEFEGYKLLGDKIRSNDTTAPFAAAMADRMWYGAVSGEKDWPSLHFGLTAEELLDKHLLIRYNLLMYFHSIGDLGGLVAMTNDR